jgi:hypothetical protein
MGVDLIRSCYKTKMRLQVNSDDETEVQWFFCLPGAKVYPGYTRFASGNWAMDRFKWPGTGEVLGATRSWVNGKPPKTGLIGQGFCGKATLIEGGYSVGDPPLPCRLSGIAKCCPKLAAEAGLTTGLGGWVAGAFTGNLDVTHTGTGVPGPVVNNGVFSGDWFDSSHASGVGTWSQGGVPIGTFVWDILRISPFAFRFVWETTNYPLYNSPQDVGERYGPWSGKGRWTDVTIPGWYVDWTWVASLTPV